MRSYETSYPIYQYAYAHSSALDEPMRTIFDVSTLIKDCRNILLHRTYSAKRCRHHSTGKKQSRLR